MEVATFLYQTSQEMAVYGQLSQHQYCTQNTYTHLTQKPLAMKRFVFLNFQRFQFDICKYM